MSASHENCQLVVFSNKAWNVIVNETFRKDPVETGGILLGHILSNGYWIVMEVVPPGLKAIHQRAYFEYDTEFVNYMANSISKQYKMELSVLGLWHRHPGSMDVFSGTDDGTNTTFAQMNAYGAISGLVNIDPTFRFTLRHVSYPLNYQVVDVEVGDDLIPSQYFELKYSYGESLTPMTSTDATSKANTRIGEPEKQSGSGDYDENSGNKNESQKSQDPVSKPTQNSGSQTNDGSSESKKDNQGNIKKSAVQKYMPVLVAGVFLLIGVLIGDKISGHGGGESSVASPPKTEDATVSGVSPTIVDATGAPDNMVEKPVTNDKHAGNGHAKTNEKNGSAAHNNGKSQDTIKQVNTGTNTIQNVENNPVEEGVGKGVGSKEEDQESGKHTPPTAEPQATTEKQAPETAVASGDEQPEK